MASILKVRDADGTVHEIYSIQGKSAYQYAQEGGYTGTEGEFTAKLAAEKFPNPNALTFTGAVTGSYDGSAPLSVEIPSGGGGGSTVELDTTLTVAGAAADAKAVGDALAGKQNTISDLETIRSGAAKGATALQAVPSTYRTATAQDAIDNGLSDRVSAIEGKEAGWDAKSNFSGNYNDLTNKPAIPTALPNPNALTFTGAVTGSYDGSAPLTVNIPAGGGGGGSSDKWELINTITVSDDATTNVTFTQDSAGNPFALKKLYLKIFGINGANTYPVIRLNGLHWTQQFAGVAAGAGANMTMSVLFELLGNGIYMWEWANPHCRDIRRTGEKAPSGGAQSLIETINSVMWLWGSSSAITNGSVFTLYGVRA